MPYHLEGKCVVGADGKAVPGGCHPTRQLALRHLRALMVNVPEARKSLGNTGAMIALYPPVALATDLARQATTLISGSESADDLHVTLLYLGDAVPLAEQEDALADGVEAFAEAHDAVVARLNGTARFDNADSASGTPFVALVDSPQLPALRQDLLALVSSLGVNVVQNHGFIPHLTLAYLPGDATAPTLITPGGDVVFGKLSLVLGDIRMDFPFREGAMAQVDKAKTAVHTPEGDKLKIGDVRHIADAITALGPGFRGNKVQLSPDDRKAAISRIRGAIEKLQNEALKKHLLQRLEAVDHGKSFHNVKSSGSAERVWRGIVSVNTYDREDQAASAQALEGIVKTLNLLGVKPELWPFHLTPEQRKAQFGADVAPGVTDWFDVVDGHLVAVGHWTDHPVSKAWADYVDAFPESHDGSGWGMSWIFGSNPDDQGVFEHISYAKEFTFLPLSQAAHGLTRFTQEVNNMSLTQEQEALIAAFKQQVKANPTFKAAAQIILEAEAQSAGLDLIGVERKSVDDAQTLHGPDGLLNQPGAENGKAAAGKCPKCGMKLSADGTCPEHGKVMDTMGDEKKSLAEEPPKPAETVKALPPMPEVKPGLQPNEAQVALGGDRPLMFSDLKDIYKAVESQVTGLILKREKAHDEALVGEINKALKPRDQALVEVAQTLDGLSIVKEATLKETTYQTVQKAIAEQQQAMQNLLTRQQEVENLSKAIQTEYGTPRILEQWKAFAASDSDHTVVGENDDLAKAAPAGLASNPVFESVGLKPSAASH